MRGGFARQAMSGMHSQGLSPGRVESGAAPAQIDLTLTPSFEAALDERLSSFFAGVLHWKLLPLTDENIYIQDQFKHSVPPDKVEEWHPTEGSLN